jgi:hydroxymethylglutaryl-CoA reductase
MKRLFEKLNDLDALAVPLFGKMSAQHMVEHLGIIVDFSNGTLVATLLTPPEKLAGMRAFLLSDKELSQGFRSPFMPQDGTLPDLIYIDIESARIALYEKWQAFEQYFSKNPNNTFMHPFFGELNYDEWIQFHKKHFIHHLKQFGL